MIRRWLLDGKEISFTNLIKKVVEYGYGDNDDGIILTSKAERMLKENGHKVECLEVEETHE